MASLADAPRPGLDQKIALMASATAAQDAVEDQTALFDSDEFRMYCYKVLPCAKRAAHEWTTCPWAHPGEKARRRDPRVYSYLAIPCPDTKEGKDCPRGDDCPNCHSLFEYWLHPSRYRTQLCRNNDGSHCKRQICFFAHSIEELRVPDHSHLNIPDELKQQSSNAAAAGSSSSSSNSTAAAGSSSSPTSTTAPAAPDSSSSGSPHGSNKAHRERRGGRNGTGKGLSAKDADAASPVYCTGVPASAAALPAVGGGLCRHPSLPSHGAGQHPLCRTLSVDVGAQHGGSSSARMASGRSGVAAADAAAGLFSSGMAGDPEVSEPLPSPQRAAAMVTAQQQQHMLALREQQQQQVSEASMGATSAQAMYEHNMNLQQLLMLQHQQQQQQLKQQHAAGWAGYGPAAAGYVSEYGSVMSSVSPPVSPDSASLMSSVGPDDGCNSSMGGHTSYGSSCSYVSPYAGAATQNAMWQRPPLPRTLSGPTNYSPQAQAVQCVQSPAFRYPSMDSGVAAAAAAASASAARMSGSASEIAAMRVKQMQQAEMMYRVMPQAGSQAMMATNGGFAAPAGSLGMCSSPSPLQQQQQFAAAQQQQQQMMLAQQQQQQQQMMQAQQQQYDAQIAQQQGTGDQLNLGDVADLVDSVNRGELGECGSQVLTGVIGLLMQQLQQQQLAA